MASAGVRCFALGTLVFGAAVSRTMGATIVVPPVTITQLANSTNIVAPPAESTSTSGVTFPSGPGTFTSSGFTAAIAQNDQVVVRFQAPAGQRFNVLMPANATDVEVVCAAQWDAGGDGSVPGAAPTSVNWIGLQGPEPTLTFSQNYVTNNSQRVGINTRFNATQEFSFLAIEITFTVPNDPPGTPRNYGSVQSTFSPSFYARARGVGLAASPAMQLVTVPLETITVPPVTITALSHQHTTGATTTTVDSVTFPSGPGAHTSSGFSAAIDVGDEIVVRYQAPAGKAFMVRNATSAQSTVLFFRSRWSSGPGTASQTVNGSVTWEIVDGPAPTQTVGQNSVADNGSTITVHHEFLVTTPFRFTAVEIRIPVTPVTSGAILNYAAVQSTTAPSVGTIATSTSPFNNFYVMDIVDLVPESIEIPPVVIVEPVHLYLPEANGPGSDDLIADGITANGLGVLSSPGFTATIGAGDEIVARFQAPAGYRFRVDPLSGVGLFRRFSVNGSWRTIINDGLIGGATISTQPAFIGLVGPQPDLGGAGNVMPTDGGNTIQLVDTFTFTQPFEFEAIEYRGAMPTITTIGNKSRNYNGITAVLPDNTLISAVFLAEVEGVGLADDFVMELVPIVPPPECAGDTNADNVVNGADLSVMLGQFGQSVTPGTGADLNGDGVVNGADLSVLLGRFGQAC